MPRADGVPAGDGCRRAPRATGCRWSTACPVPSYTSEAEFARERDRVLFPGWFCVGRADDLTGPGCYLAADVCGESIIVARTEEGGLAGYYNLCRHRGSRLVPQPACRIRRSRRPPRPRPGRWPAAGSAAASAAPTTPGPTGWTGRCGLPRSCPRCASTGPRCPCTRWRWPPGAGFVFARLEPPASPDAAGPLAATLGEIPARVAGYPLADLRAGARLRYDVAANWKVILENYNECYHCGPVHPELCELVPAFRRGGGDLDWAAGIPHRPGATTFTVTGTTRRAPFPGLSEAERTRHFGELVLPNLMLSLSADHVAAFTVWPRSAGQTTVLCDFLFQPAELARPGFDPSDAVGFWDLVNRQDWSICEQVQDGMGSRRLSAGYLAPMEQPSADIGRYVTARLARP